LIVYIVLFLNLQIAFAEHNTQVPDPLLVNTVSGPIEGTIIKRHCEPAYAWYGIPFAKPPINELRYKRPIPIESWTEIFKADQKPNACVQPVLPDDGLWYTPPEIMSEDCLYLNILRPTTLNKSMPVMVYIHGGGFIYGASTNEIYDLQCLATIGNVIAVSVQYRVANLGFLYISQDTAPGNMGLMDQQLALKWIKNNIEHFGGDPNQITIFGQSAGGSSVSFHMIAPDSRNLYKRAIIEAGASTAIWSFVSNEQAIGKARELAQNVGCKGNVNDNYNIFNCLQTIDTKTLIENDATSDIPQFTPTIDGEFINDTPKHLWSHTIFQNVDVMSGTSYNEGDNFVSKFLLDAGVTINQFPNNVTRSEAIKVLEYIIAILPAQPYVKSAGDIIDFYANTDTNGNYFKAVSRAFGDWHLDCEINQIEDILAESGANSHKYVFAHNSKFRPDRSQGVGASHCEETFYHFGQPLKKDSVIKFTRYEKKLSEKMIKYWTNFARTGNPNLNIEEDWPQYSYENKDYGLINLRETSKKQNWRKESCDYLKSIDLIQ